MKMVVVILRGANTSFLPAYGNSWVHLPNLSVLSARGLTLDHYYASSWDEKSIRASWLSGQFSGGFLGSDSWLGVLKKAGWQSSYISDEDEPTARGFAGDFDRVQYQVQGRGDPLLLHEALLADPVFQSPEDGIVWLESGFLLPPWQVGEDFLGPAREELHDYLSSREEIAEGLELPDPILDPAGMLPVQNDISFLAVQSGLAAAWTQVDDFVGAIAASLQENFPNKDYALVITSDRGMGSGDHGACAFEPALLYREWVHLPFLLYAPFLDIAGRRMLGFWQDIDLAPTLVDLAKISGWQCQGASILKGENIFSGGRSFAISEFHAGNASQFALRTGSHTFLECCDPTGAKVAKYFVLPDDRLELNDASKSNGGHVEDCEKVIHAWAKGDKALAEEMLKSLEGGH